MKLIYDLVYMPGGDKENEDAYAINEKTGVYAAIDGATGLGGISGKTAAQCVKVSLENLSSTHSLIDAVKIANNKLNEETLSQLDITTIEELPKEERSSCGVAAVRLGKNQLEYVHAGDCMIFIQYTNNEIQHVTYDHLAKLDAQSISQYREALANRIHSQDTSSEQATLAMREAREEILPFLIENRRKLNTDSGYGIIDGSNDALNYLSHGQIPLQDAKKVLIVSDGLQLPMNKATGISSWEETAVYAFENGLTALKEEVLRLETSDIACMIYPRLKFSDDKTGILINI